MTRRSALPAVLTAALVAAVALLSVHSYDLWQHLDDPVELEPAGSTTGNAPATLSPGAWEAPPLKAFSAVSERPLFAETRRPFQSASQPTAAPPPALLPEAPAPIEFSLVGIALSEGQSIALVRRRDDGKVFRVIEGDEVLGWTASSISRARAIFRRGDREEALELKFGTSQPVSPGMPPLLPPDAPDMGAGGEPEDLPASPDQGG